MKSEKPSKNSFNFKEHNDGQNLLITENKELKNKIIDASEAKLATYLEPYIIRPRGTRIEEEKN